MGACATKSGDLKVKGEPAPLVVEDAVAEEEKPKKPADGVPVPAAAQTDSADVSRRRSLSDLLKLKEDTEASDDRDEADQEAVKVVTQEDSVGGAPPATLPVLEEVAKATKAPDVAVVPPAAVVEQDTEQDTEASDDRDEAAQEAVKVKVATEDSAGGAPTATATLPEEEEAEAAKVPDVAVVPPSTADPAVVEQDTVTEQEADDGAKASQEQEEEKRVDPDSVQVAAAPSGEEESKVDGPSP